MFDKEVSEEKVSKMAICCIYELKGGANVLLFVYVTKISTKARAQYCSSSTKCIKCFLVTSRELAVKQRWRLKWSVALSHLEVSLDKILSPVLHPMHPCEWGLDYRTSDLFEWKSTHPPFIWPNDFFIFFRGQGWRSTGISLLYLYIRYK